MSCLASTTSCKPQYKHLYILIRALLSRGMLSCLATGCRASQRAVVPHSGLSCFKCDLCILQWAAVAALQSLRTECVRICTINWTVFLLFYYIKKISWLHCHELMIEKFSKHGVDCSWKAEDWRRSLPCLHVTRLFSPPSYSRDTVPLDKFSDTSSCNNLVM